MTDKQPPVSPPSNRPFARIDTFFSRVAGVALLAMMFLTVISSLGRYLFTMPVPDMVVINEMLLVAVVFLPMAFTQMRGEHVEVTLFTDRLSPAAVRRFVMFGYLIGLISTTFLTYALAKGAYRAFWTADLNFGVYQIYTWPTRVVASFGMALLALRLTVDLVTLIKGPGKH